MAGPNPRPLVAGNWKMNGSRASVEVLRAILEGASPDLRERVGLLLCPPATLIAAFAEVARGSGVAIGGQDCHAGSAGAHTGDLSAGMLADAGASYVIVGHSERRQDHGESDDAVKQKAAAAVRAGLVALVCVGETRAERESGRAIDIVLGQLAGSLPEGATSATLAIAYEPVWAIGTGLVPTAADVGAMHAAIRRELSRLVGEREAPRTRILYGGSVKPSNAHELLAVEHVDGALVGGASLVAADFLAIAGAARTR